MSPKGKKIQCVFTGRGFGQTYDHPTTKGMKKPLTGFIAALLKCREVKKKIAYICAAPHGGHAHLYFSALSIA
jgi:hypothetical protein